MIIIYTGLLILCFIIEGKRGGLIDDGGITGTTKAKHYKSSNTGLIAGVVIGSLIGLSIIIALIIICVVICVKRSGNTTVRVIPINQGGVNVIQTSQQQGPSMYSTPQGGHPQYGQYPLSRHYNTQYGQNPPSGQNNPQNGHYPPPSQVPKQPAFTSDPPPLKQ